jgi:hypothetical protein
MVKMKSLGEIKLRLLALPQRRSARDLEAKYSAFLEKTSRSREKIEDAVKAASVVVDAMPGTSYAEALARARKAASQASRIRTSLETDAKNIGQASVERSFTLMNEHAGSAWMSCQEIWQKLIDTKVKDWAPLVDIVSKLVPDQGTRLRNTLDTLQGVRNKCPTTKVEARKVKENLDILGEIIAKLGLETAFGRFLRSVASPEGANLTEAQNPEVQTAIAQHKLDRLFRVKLSQ